ncbi:MAG: DNA polymerase III subunit gamma/tau, partial [Methylocystis sp.]|nr:DNA polymerase III subunit gamma/tau [Methylocystis sp.]
RAAEGSVRDALSLLDQAIAYGAAHRGGAIASDDLRLMLGVADKARVIDLFEATMRGDVAATLAMLEEQYTGGADPAQVLLELAEFTHLATRLKLVPDVALSSVLTQEERRRGAAAAERLSIPVLTRAWQILMKGVDELRVSQRPLAGADMVLVRLAHAAELPTPDEALRRLGFGQADSATGAPSVGAAVNRAALQPSGAQAPTAPLALAPRAAPSTIAAVRASAAPKADTPPQHAADLAQAQGSVAIADFPALVTLAAEKGDRQLEVALQADVRLVRFEQGRIEFALASGASPRIAPTLMQRLQEWTGARWLVAIAARFIATFSTARNNHEIPKPNWCPASTSPR